MFPRLISCDPRSGGCACSPGAIATTVEGCVLALEANLPLLFDAGCEVFMVEPGPVGKGRRLDLGDVNTAEHYDVPCVPATKAQG